MSATLARSFLALLVLLIAALAATVADAGPSWIRALAPNVVAEIFGILLVVGLVDQVLRRRAEDDRRRRRRQAFLQLKLPLHRLVGLLLRMKRGASNEPHQIPEPHVDLSAIDPHEFAATISTLDLGADAPILPRTAWFPHVMQRFEEFNSALERTVDMYGFYLDVEDIELIENVRGAHLPGLIAGVASAYLMGAAGEEGRYDIMPVDYVEDYVIQIWNLVRRADSALDGELGIRV